MPDLEVTPGQGSTRKQPRHPPVAQALRQSRVLEYFDTKYAVKTHPEAPDLCERTIQHLTSESEQMDQGGGTELWLLTGKEPQQKRPRRSDPSVEMLLSADVLATNPTAAGAAADAGDAESQRSEVTEPVKSGLISDSGFDATETMAERQDESPLIITAAVPTETEDSSTAEAAEDFKPHKGPDLPAPTLMVQSEKTVGGVIVVSANDMKENQALFDRPETVSPTQQTPSQHLDAEAEAGEVEDVHAHTVMEDQRYNNVTLVFNNSTQPSSDLSPDVTAGDSFFLSKSKSTQRTAVSAYQPSTDTNPRKGAKLKSGVRGQRVGFGLCSNISINVHFILLLPPQKKQSGLRLLSGPFNPAQYVHIKISKSPHICCQHFQ